MGILDKLFGKKAKPNKADQRIFSQIFYGSNIITEEDPNEDEYIYRGYEQNPTVYAIVSMIANTASQIPFYVYKKKADGTKERIEMPLLQELLYRPNPLEPFCDIVKKSITYKLVNGNSFIWGVNPDENSLNAGKPQSLFVLPSQDMQIWQDNPQTGISQYTLDFNRETMPIAPDEILHLRNPNLRYDVDGSFLWGQSPLRAAFTNLLTANDAILTGKSYLDNQGPQTLLTAKHSDHTPSFDAEQARELKNQFRKQSQGASNAGGVLITPMDFNVLPTGMSAADVKLIEQYNLTKIDICNVYGISPVLLSIGSATYENQREAKLSMWEDIIIPLLREFRDGMNKQFIYKFGKDICIDFDLSDVLILNERIIKQAEGLVKLQNHLTVDEVRERLGYKPLGGEFGDNPLPLQGTTGIGDPNSSNDATKT